MYKLRPINQSGEEIPVPTCIYKLRTIMAVLDVSEGSNSDGNVPVVSNAEDDHEILELEKRWDTIASRLQQLQNEIVDLELSSNNIVMSHQTIDVPTPTVDELTLQQDVIIHRISSLMTSLSDLKSRLAIMDDPQSKSSTTGLQLQQETLLDRIRELNNEIKTISSALNNNNNNNLKQNLHCCSKRTQCFEVVPPEFQDLVIRAHPSRPPYSLPLIMKQLESHQIRIYARTHVHSSSSNVPLSHELKQFLCSDSQLERRQANLALTLIWTDGQGEEPSLMVSPSSQSVPIVGEANIGRYLARLIPGMVYENAGTETVSRLNQFLDMTDSSAALGSSKRDRASALQQIELTLANAGSLSGSPEIGWVDAVVYSALVNAKLTGMNKNTLKWFQRCSPSSVKK